MPHKDADATLVAFGLRVSDLWVNRSVPVLKGVNLTARVGQHLAILGPSGCGKTTLLRAVAGLQPLASGEIWLGTKLIASAGSHEAVERRRVGLVFQDGALFPHMNVAANVAYGLPQRERMRRFGRTNDKAQQIVQRMLELFGLAGFAQRLPGSLSGGQQQRVAVARALVAQPSVLLFDEPFSSLDSNLRAGVRSEVVQILRELSITAIFVTHDQTEAFELGDEVAVMREGVLVQQATPMELYKHPKDPWLASFVGEAELLSGFARGNTAETVLGNVPLENPQMGPVEVLVRPEEILISLGHGAKVAKVDYCGHDSLTTVVLPSGTVFRSRSTGEPRFSVGAEVAVSHSGAKSIAYGGSLQSLGSEPLLVDAIG